MTIGSGSPGSRQKNETRPEIANTGPTERSTPPVMMTKVVQVAMTPISPTCRTMPMRLSGSRNAGSAIAKTIMMTAIASGSAFGAMRRASAGGEKAVRRSCRLGPHLPHDVFDVNRVGVVDRRQSAGNHHADAVRQRHDLFQVGRDDQHRRAQFALAPQIA